MPTIQLPNNGWRPRWYQQNAWNTWERGCKRQLLFWHRRAGKDEINLNMHAVSAHERPGTYWHMLPEAAQARKAIWNAVNPHTGKRRLFEAFPEALIENMNDNEMFVRFKVGSTFQVVGSDNFNSLVGSPPVGITFSEWALANPAAWAYLSPILAENGGWASFITTPRGNNHAKGMLDVAKKDAFDRVSNPLGWFTEVLTVDDTQAISADSIERQRREYTGLFGKEVADLLIEQEFYCSFSGALIGSYWGAEIARAERAFRIGTPFEIDRNHPVHTAWDLGKASNNPIWCFQVIDGVPLIVDFYVPNSEDLSDWCKWLDEQGYHGNDYVPHDILHPQWGTKRTRLDTLRDHGRKPKMVGMVSLAEGNNAGLQTIKLARFRTTERVADGIEGLKAYRREYDDEKKTFRDIPVKNWAEHYASAFRYLGLAWRQAVAEVQKPQGDKGAYVGQKDGTIRSQQTVKEAVDAMVRRRRARAGM
ncbi:MAG: hypothetical protein EOQ55_00765 [Mesorhizobium sp.]|uniref:hypothetical protein n=1 Tax=unclassified Mesorhizobium TaxID=325217 RepID=UPI000FCAEE60|nr:MULTISPECIES: hypothetical protein [unclassified Mesorhizobium]RUV41080.1 hypothetical protein EOD29_25195 [Mesorhizobium sp. M1A.T.Ca.IN.004.03.1.1]RWG23320.1 MAG: hypothetical protein EOQ55_00765 [Mesorhizobium sp.]RWK30826.1 MAG: hypothetical protein EOR40_24660 [Mesorhizobium sp.]RWK91402.1 MAG: hypothetical protein EOR52_03920 [Mesorhizobium sp.]TIP18903.1 MAG: hypothetical protein E5X66_14210 [Mesorhizobium sp.]